MNAHDFEAVIGLEVHAELKTDTKIFCSCSTSFGAPPNTQCCPICLGLPGAMPTLNRHAVALAIRAGLALDCRIARHSSFDRKHYFYPDLPKAYQITQDRVPLCEDGSLAVQTEAGEIHVGIARIHIEEDAGKLIHAKDGTLVDCNRCGIPLIEIVSQPTLRSAADAAAYLRTLRAVLVAAGVSDCRMEEGSLRCDVNVSVRPKGSDRMGVRTEIKNLNSFAFVEKALNYEIRRQTDLLLQGLPMQTQTRRFDPTTGQTLPMRAKERAVDYRFMPEPDLPHLRLTDSDIEAARATLPELPMARAARLCEAYGITAQDARLLTADLALADYFEQTAQICGHVTLMLHLLCTDLLRYCETDPFVCCVAPSRLASVADMMGEGNINSATAKLLIKRLAQSDFDPREAVEREQLAQLRDPVAMQALIDRVLSENRKIVLDYLGGKQNAIRALQGRVMAMSAGRADPILLQQLLQQSLARLSDVDLPGVR